MSSAFYFFGGLADTFVSVMLWFILDFEQGATVVVDGDRVYAVLDVIRLRDSGGINEEDCVTEDQQEDVSAEYVPNRTSGISKLMIEQFFEESEESDKEWEQQNYSDVFGEDDDRTELILFQ